MILKAVKILPFMLASVNPSSFHLDQPKKTNETNYTQNINVDWKQSIHQNIDYPEVYDNKKYQKTSASDAFLINATTYVNTYYNESDMTALIYKQPNRYQSSMLTVLQITPYQNTRNNTLTINLRIVLGIANDNYADTYTMYTKQYTSTENYWQKYVDASSITNPTFNYDAIADITNSQNGFIYTEQTYQTPITETAQPDYQNKTIATTLYVNPNKTNYVYYYTYNIYTYESDSIATRSQLRSGTTYMFIPTGNGNSLTITGQIINPISNYEVVDIPDIMWEVFSMPFTFISVAFNLTLFPNTPYQINISNLFLSIIGIIVFIFILNKMVLKK